MGVTGVLVLDNVASCADYSGKDQFKNSVISPIVVCAVFCMYIIFQ